MSKPGDEITFVKRTHELLEDGRMVIRVHRKHLDQLCKFLRLSKRLQCKKTPGHSAMEIPDRSSELGQQDALMYRTCVGLLLYLSADLPQCQYVIRYLSTFSSKPTEKSLMVLKHLVGDMAAHSDQRVSLKWKGLHAGVFKQYENEEPIVEISSDADWAADRETRRPVSGSAVYFGGCLTYSSSRTQKIVSLSSPESETYAAASAAMDAILITTIFLMATSMSHHDVFVFGFISCKRCAFWKRCRSFKAFELQSSMASRSFLGHLERKQSGRSQ